MTPVAASRRRPGRHRRAAGTAGFTMVEMMVTLVIMLAISIALMNALSTFEGRKRTASSMADINVAAAAVVQQLDLAVRSAGAGFVQAELAAGQSFGCPLFASRSGTVVLPAGSLPAPFENVLATTGALRLAPVVILPGNTAASRLANATQGSSDVIVTFGSNAAIAGMPVPFTAAPAAAALPTQNSAAFAPNDLVLVTDAPTATGRRPCMLQQVSSAFVAGTTPATAGAGVSIPLAGTFAAASIAGGGAGTATLANYTVDSLALPMGNATNPPRFMVLGVGDNTTLYGFDLLSGATAAQPLADSVIEMHALYGIDSNNDGTVDAWADGTTAPYRPADLLAGTDAAAGNIARIRAVRIGVILRTPLRERDPVAPATLTLFDDLPCPTQAATCTNRTAFQYTRTLGTDERNFRYRTFEVTVPVRNQLLG